MRVAPGTQPNGRIGFIVSRFPVRTETFIVRELWGLQRAGLDFDLLALWPPTETIQSTELRDLAPRVHYAPTPPATSEEINGWWARWVATQVTSRELSHLHAHFAWGASRVAQLSSRLCGVPYSFTAHAGDIYAGSNAETLAGYADGADCILTCTRANLAVVTDIVARRPTPPSVFCFYHGLPASWLQEPGIGRSDEGDPLILSVGRLVPTKGHAVLVEAVRRLARSGRRVRCVVVGDGPERDDLERQIAAGALGEVVTFRSGLSGSQMRELYRAASVCVHAGIIGEDGDRDGIPNAVVEAMAIGTPVVATALESSREIIGDDAGLLVPAGDPGGLADALVALLDAPERAARCARVASRRVRERFDLGENSEQLACFWRDWLGKRSAHDPAAEQVPVVGTP